jgi:hypothetical protein
MTKKNKDENKDLFEGHENQGEGNKTAAKEYDDAATQHAHSGAVAKEAKDARDALEGTDGQKLRDAEAEGKKRIKEEDSELSK